MEVHSKAAGGWTESVSYEEELDIFKSMEFN